MIFVKIYTPGVLSRLGHTFDPIPPSRVNIVDMRTFVKSLRLYSNTIFFSFKRDTVVVLVANSLLIYMLRN